MPRGIRNLPACCNLLRDVRGVGRDIPDDDCTDDRKNLKKHKLEDEKRQDKCYYSQPTTHMRIRRLFEAPVSLLTELRLLMWVEFLLRRLDMDVQSSSYMQA